MVAALLVAVFVGSAGAQTDSFSSSAPDAYTASTADAALPEAPQPAVDNPPVTVRNTALHTLQDQPKIFTSPIRVRAHDLVWLVPLAGAAGAAFGTDQRTMRTVVSRDSGFNQANVNASNAMIGTLIAAPVALFGVGEFRANPHAREAGLLAGEAMVDGVIVEQVFKLATYRERPGVDNSAGKFYVGDAGPNSSFPSAHSTIAWSSAAVLAEEYPTFWARAGIYSLATGVSLTRVMGQQHFPSDVLVGSAFGWLIGHYVYKAHHGHSGGL